MVEQTPDVAVSTESVPQVESAAAEEVRQVEETAPEEVRQVEEVSFVPESLREKTAEKVTDAARTLSEMCRSGGVETFVGRNFSQDLRGKWAGWRLVVDLKITVERV